VSVLGFGGSEIGFERAEPGIVRRLLREALDAGLNVIDTAECYGDSEALVGQAVADRRSEYLLFTKCGHFEGTGRDDWSPASLEKSIARSLARLRTDHVDLLQLHTCTVTAHSRSATASPGRAAWGVRGGPLVAPHVKQDGTRSGSGARPPGRSRRAG
jgi:aryl-alcohol dehydrogenase-like predicted oxidoreductase